MKDAALAAAQDRLLSLPNPLVPQRISREPSGATLRQIDVLPASGDLQIGETLTPSIIAIYSDGTRIQRWITTHDLVVSPSNPAVIQCADPATWCAVGPGTCWVSVTYQGISATNQYSIADSRIAFAGWREQNFSPDELSNPEISGPDADSDQDQLNVIMEYLTAGNPLAKDAFKALWIAHPGKATNPVAVVRRSHGVKDISIVLEKSSDLVDWTPYVQLDDALQPNGHPILQSIRTASCQLVLIDTGIPSEQPRFFRLKTEIH